MPRIEDTARAALLLRTTLEILRDASGPMWAREVLAEVASRVEFTLDELEPVTPAKQPLWEYHLQRNTGEVTTIGWMTKIRGWAITEAGESALDAFPRESLWMEFSRRLADVQQHRKQYKRQLVGAEQKIADAVDLVGPGFWTSQEDLAELTSVDPTIIRHVLAQGGLAGSHRVLTADGTLPPESLEHFRSRGGDLAERLAGEGVEFDSSGRASQEQRVTVAELRDHLGEWEPKAPTKRAWLVRGSSVEGRDLVPVWLRKDSVSLAASSLRVITPPVSRGDLKSFVDKDYEHKSYAAREAKLAEFDAFCNRMQVDDFLLSTTQGKAYIGKIIGDAEYVSSSDQRSNLRRTVKWFNDTRPVPFNKLPNPLPAKLSNQSDVVELTEDIASVESLLRELGVEVSASAPAREGTLAFPPVTPELVDDLMIADPNWLERLANLLWHRKHVILYGPPGTGKTYLARKLADHLTGQQPGTVKLVQFHPSYTYEDFFEGFRPKQKDEKLIFDIHRGPFRLLVDDARDHPADPYILIIDEINRANLAKVFGELYFLLEYRREPISLLYSTETDFTLPENVFVIGTMNTSDRSIALVDAAMRRRFAFVELHPSQPPTSGFLREWLRREAEKGGIEHHADAADLLDALNRAIDDRDFAIGPSYLMHEYIYQDVDALAEVWETSILPLLEEQHYGSPRGILDRYHLDTLRKALNGDES